MKLGKKQKLAAFISIIIGFIIFLYLLNQPQNIPKDSFHVILITVDALRSDHLSCYGYERKTSPNIDKLSEEGVIFTNAISQGSATIPSLPSLMTSLYPSQHGVKRINLKHVFTVPTLAEILKVNGYYTVGIVDHNLKHTGLDRGFDSIEFSNGQLTASNVTQKAISLLRKSKDKNLFLWLHYFDPHAPYNPPFPYDELFLDAKFKKMGREFLKKNYVWLIGSGAKSRLPLPHVSMPIDKPPQPIFQIKEIDRNYYNILTHDFKPKIPHGKRLNVKQSLDKTLTKEDREYYISQYDGEIRYADEQIGALLNELKRLRLYKHTIVILTADHGELLADRSKRFGHGSKLFDVLLKVPLIIKGKGISGHKIINEQVRLIDIMPTILDALEMNTNIKMEGENLLPLILGKRDDINNYAFSESEVAKSVRTNNWKLIYDFNKNQYKLFDLKHDPLERRNLKKLKKEKFAELNRVLRNWMIEKVQKEPASTSEPLDEETKQILRSLGYAQ